ncbi:MAG: phospholipase D-like domain-containing protein [Myxococcota bacterium]
MAKVTDEQLDDLLRQSFDDERLSRAERRVLRALVDEGVDGARIRRRAFELARTLDGNETNKLAWLEDVARASTQAAVRASSEVHFSPGNGCRNRIARALGEVRERAEICVFTITDNHLVDAILAAKKRGVRVRIAADNDKARDRGSDIERLAEAGVDVRVDRSPHHMHHKFAVFDGELLLNGSYNWTRSAFAHNRENLVAVRSPQVVQRFADAFESMWSDFEAV